MAKIYSLDFIPVGTTNDVSSDHRIYVNGDDREAGFLIDKQAPTSQIGFVNDPQNTGKFLVLLDKNNPYEQESQGVGLLRSIVPFSPQQIDTSITNLAGSQRMSKVIIFPMTISIGSIEGFSIVCKNQDDFANIDRLQVAIVSNTVNNIAGSKLEFFGQYGYGNSMDNLVPAADNKSFGVVEGSNFDGIHDLNCNYHFVAFFIHFDSSSADASSRGLLAKSSSGSPLKEVGKNTNYCGEEANRSTIVRSGFVDLETARVSDSYRVETNLLSPFPYIEFYQVRGV